MAIGDKLKVTRDQLAEFIESHNTIRQFERLFEYINTFVIPIIEQDSLPETYGISVADTVIVLPTITGEAQRFSYYWTGGDGTYTISFTGLADYIGEGEGNIEIESDGIDWQVNTYSDSGSNSNGTFVKQKDGTLINKNTDISLATNDVVTFAKEFLSTSYVWSASGNGSNSYVIDLNTTATASAVVRVKDTADAFVVSSDSNYTAIGRWKT